jgi:hypothetical protein
MLETNAKFYGVPERKGLPGRYTHNTGIYRPNIKMNLKETGSVTDGDEPSCSIKDRELFGQLSDYWLL